MATVWLFLFVFLPVSCELYFDHYRLVKQELSLTKFLKSLHPPHTTWRTWRTGVPPAFNLYVFIIQPARHVFYDQLSLIIDFYSFSRENIEYRRTALVQGVKNIFSDFKKIPREKCLHRIAKVVFAPRVIKPHLRLYFRCNFLYNRRATMVYNSSVGGW